MSHTIQLLDFNLLGKKIRYFSNNGIPFFCLLDINSVFNIPDIHSMLRSLGCEYFKIKIENGKVLNFVNIESIFNILFSNSFKKNFKTNNFILDSTTITNTLSSVWKNSYANIFPNDDFNFDDNLLFLDIKNCNLYNSKNTDLKLALYFFFSSFKDEFIKDVDYICVSDSLLFSKKYINSVLSKKIKLYEVSGLKDYIYKKPFSFKKALEEIEFNLR